MKSPGETEAFALKLSVAGYLFMAVLGVSFSMLTQSEAILLDGVYSLLSFIMALIAQRVSKLVEIPSSDTFHFGYGHFEPWINAIRALLILILCAFALFSAIDALIHGGRPLSPGLGVVYGVSAAVGCLSLAALQHRYSKQVGSPLLVVDSRNWLVDGIVSSGVALTFIVATLIKGTPWSRYVPYVDPALVLVMAAFLIRIPIVTFWENMMEVLQVAPDPVVQEEVRARVRDAVAGIPARRVEVGMVKVGRFFYARAHVILPGDYGVKSISDLDDIRSGIGEALQDLEYRLVLDTIFTADEKWIIGEVEQKKKADF